MTGHIRIVNDPVELVPLLLTFTNPKFKQMYELLNKNWMTEEELTEECGGGCVAPCLSILRKGNLIEEQWRMPKPGERPCKEFRTTYGTFRANFQCSMTDLADLIYVALSTDEHLRTLVTSVEGELGSGNSSIADIARRLGVSPLYIKALSKRMPNMDVKGQGLIHADTTR
ncbi:ArsR family transcriptional regulator [Methanofollis fontis]|uniref:ArsR family transcriptional regulator n=1 Tax=Methanofollis fontis TaxID=2052832 RepID=A0A483CLV6_9EURY|nr:ArsR family transcriptional regulator [Methanofollis fontis]